MKGVTPMPNPTSSTTSKSPAFCAGAPNGPSALSKEGYCNCRVYGMIQNRALVHGMIQTSALDSHLLCCVRQSEVGSYLAGTHHALVFAW